MRKYLSASQQAGLLSLGPCHSQEGQGPLWGVGYTEGPNLKHSALLGPEWWVVPAKLKGLSRISMEWWNGHLKGREAGRGQHMVTHGQGSYQQGHCLRSALGSALESLPLQDSLLPPNC